MAYEGSTQTAGSRKICPECEQEYLPEYDECPNDGAELVAFDIAEYAVDDVLGRKLDDRFFVTGAFGERGVGKLYRGMQLSVDRSIALKVLRPELSDDDDVVDRFFREARVISEFNNPNIVNLVDFGRDEGEERDVLYLAMEYVDGVTLDELLAEGRLEAELVVETAIQICDALSEPHGQGVVHRDLKPEAMMLVPIASGGVQAKIVDFGIAHAVTTHETRVTKEGEVFGTARYLAPEQLDARDVEPPADIYALGAIIFEMLTGVPPFQAERRLDLASKHLSAEPPVVASALSGEPQLRDLSELVRQMMAKDPQDRPEGILAVRDRLEQLQREHRHASIRVDPSASRDVIFSDWIRQPVDAEKLAAEAEPVSQEQLEASLPPVANRPESVESFKVDSGEMEGDPRELDGDIDELAGVPVSSGDGGGGGDSGRSGSIPGGAGSRVSISPDSRSGVGTAPGDERQSSRRDSSPGGRAQRNPSSSGTRQRRSSSAGGSSPPGRSGSQPRSDSRPGADQTESGRGGPSTTGDSSYRTNSAGQDDRTAESERPDRADESEDLLKSMLVPLTALFMVLLVITGLVLVLVIFEATDEEGDRPPADPPAAESVEQDREGQEAGDGDEEAEEAPVDQEAEPAESDPEQ